MEAQKAATYQAMRAQVGGLPSLSSLKAALPVDKLHLFQDSRSRFHRRHEDMLELEAQGSPPPPYQQQTPLTPPASDDEAPEVDSDEGIRHLQKEVIQKESKIKSLESEIELEKGKRRHLQVERHEAVDAQRRAEDEVRKLRMKIANLDQLLDGSIKREKDLESELDICRQESRELKRQLHEERCNYEIDLRAQETRGRQIREQAGVASGKLLNENGGDRRPFRDAESVLEGEVQSKKSPQRDVAARWGQSTKWSTDAPSRSRKQDRRTSGKAYVSIPKHGNRRALFVLG